MKESRKNWKSGAESAQFYCAILALGILILVPAITGAAPAAPLRPDPILNPQPYCGDDIPAADLRNGVSVYGGPLVPVAPSPEARLGLVNGVAGVPVHTPLPRYRWLELHLDISDLMEPPQPACLPPDLARDRAPLKARPAR